MSNLHAILFIASWFVVGYAIRKGLKLDHDINQAIANHGELLFDEQFVSGTRLGPIPRFFGAGWALRVVVNRETVWIWPMLAFRPAFLAMIFGLEHKVPRDQVSIEAISPPGRQLFGRRSVIISVKPAQSKIKRVKLYLKQPEAFAAAVSGYKTPSHSIPGGQMSEQP